MTRSSTMLYRIAIPLVILLLICTALVGGLAYWATPTIVIQNHSGDTVRVTAQWGTSRKELPAVSPGAKRTFKVAGESAIEFVVTYPDSTQLRSLPMYFTTATTVTAVVTDRVVEVTADLK